MEPKFLHCIAYLLLQLVHTQAQIYPTRFVLPPETRSANGSSITGRCSNFDAASRSCTAPTSSVLFDGVVPSLSGRPWLDGESSASSASALADDAWASQLLTVNSASASIEFDFTGVQGYVGVQGIEVVTFDCPEWAIGVSVGTLQVWGGDSVLSNVNIQEDDGARSCTLVTRCMEVLVRDQQVRLQFHAAVGVTEWVHLAEVRFYGSSLNLDCGRQEGEQTTMTVTEEEDSSTTVMSRPGNSSETQTDGGASTNTTTSTTTQHEETQPAHTTLTTTTTTTTPTTNNNNNNNNNNSDRGSSCKPCPSCSTPTILAVLLTALLTGLLATIIFVLVQIAICKHFLKKINLQRTRPATGAPVTATHYHSTSNSSGSNIGEVQNHHYEQPINLMPWSVKINRHGEANRLDEVADNADSHSYMEMEYGNSGINMKDNDAYIVIRRTDVTP